MRPTLRWQRDVAAWCKSAWDVELLELRDNGEVKLSMSDKAPLPRGLNIPGERIELLDADRVIAVGTVTHLD